MAAAGGPIRLIKSPSKARKAILLENHHGHAESQLHIFRIGAFQDGALADELPILYTVAKVLLERRYQFKLIVILTAKPDMETNHQMYKELTELQGVIEVANQADIDNDFPGFDLCLWMGVATEQPVHIVKGMAEGVPWIAIGSKHVVELLFGKDGDAHGPAGFVVPPGAADMIADYCEWFMEHPEIRRQFAENGRRRARELDGI